MKKTPDPLELLQARVRQLEAYAEQTFQELKVTRYQLSLSQRAPMALLKKLRKEWGK